MVPAKLARRKKVLFVLFRWLVTLGVLMSQFPFGMSVKTTSNILLDAEMRMRESMVTRTITVIAS